MATLLDDRLVADAMQNLDEWSGDAKRISRTVRVDDADDLLAKVGEAADALNHHPEIERDGDGITFVLWTHSEGGVTELDIALASRIDDLVLGANHLERGAHGRVRSVAGAPTEEGEIAGRTVTAEASYPSGGRTTPSRPEESSTGDPYPDSGDTRRTGDKPGTFNEPATPRQDVGGIIAPDDTPGSIEPLPGRGKPGLHENPAAADETA